MKNRRFIKSMTAVYVLSAVAVVVMIYIILSVSRYWRCPGLVISQHEKSQLLRDFKLNGELFRLTQTDTGDVGYKMYGNGYIDVCLRGDGVIYYSRPSLFHWRNFEVLCIAAAVTAAFAVISLAIVLCANRHNWLNSICSSVILIAALVYVLRIQSMINFISGDEQHYSFYYEKFKKDESAGFMEEKYIAHNGTVENAFWEWRIDGLIIGSAGDRLVVSHYITDRGRLIGVMLQYGIAFLLMASFAGRRGNRIGGKACMALS